MLRISWQTLRSRRATLAGAFVAIFLAVTVAYATGLLMAGALSAPGPGRLAAADVVVRTDPAVTVGRGDDAERVDVVPAPRLPAAAVTRAAAVPGVVRAVGDVSFPAGAWDDRGREVRPAGVERLQGHGWQSAELTPYRLREGRGPAGEADVVADARLGLRVGAALRVVTPVGDATYRVSGVADGRANQDRGQAALFFAPAVAQRLSGAPGRVNAVGIVAEPGTPPGELRAALRKRVGPGVEILDRRHAADADAGDPRAADRDALVAIFGTMGGIAGAIALFVVAGTFALAIAQRRRETAVLRALGASPRQVRRLIATEAFILSAVGSALGLLAGRPLALAIVDVLADHGAAPHGFELGRSWVPLAAAVGLGIGISQLAVVAAARRAGRVRPAEALREVAVEHGRPGLVRTLCGLACLAGGATIALAFSGEAARAFAILSALLLAGGTALLGRWLLGLPVALLSVPFRALGAPGLLASAGLRANRWRSAALATPILLVAMLVGTQGVLQNSSQRHTERVTAARVTAGHVVVGRDGAPLPAGTAGQVARLEGVDAVASTLPTQVFLLGEGLSGWDAPWPAAGLTGTGAARTLDLNVRRGRLRDVRGRAVGVSRVVATEGHVKVGDVIPARMADGATASLRVVAIYARAAGLGDVVLDPALARRHAVDQGDGAIFVAGPSAGRSLARFAAARPGIEAMSRSEYLGTVRSVNNDQAWGVWLIIGLSVAFAVLALVNTAAMATAERRGELATIRLLGGTAGQATRMVALELAPVVVVALAAGAAIAAAAVMGVPDGVRGIPLIVPATGAGGLLAGAALLGLAAGVVTARLALRASPAAAMRLQE